MTLSNLRDEIAILRGWRIEVSDSIWMGRPSILRREYAPNFDFSREIETVHTAGSITTSSGFYPVQNKAIYEIRYPWLPDPTTKIQDAWDLVLELRSELCTSILKSNNGRVKLFYSQAHGFNHEFYICDHEMEREVSVCAANDEIAISMAYYAWKTGAQIDIPDPDKEGEYIGYFLPTLYDPKTEYSK